MFAWMHPRFLSLKFWGWSALWLALLVPVYRWVGTHYLVGIDSREEGCIGPDRIFLIERANASSLWRGDLVSFKSDERMYPYFQPGQIVVKFLAGVPGDRVVVDSDGVYVNGTLVAKGLANAAKLNRPPSDFYLDAILQPGHYFVVAPSPKSFDSRYWGFLLEDQIIGKARPIPYLTRILEWIFGRIPRAKAEENTRPEVDISSIQELRDRARAGLEEPWAPNRYAEQAETWAREMADKTLRQVFSDGGMAAVSHQRVQFVVLVSASLGEGRLKEMFAAYGGKEDVVFAFQGLLAGQKIEDFAAYVRDTWIEGIDPPPNIVLDPLIFQEHGVTHVPVLLAFEGDKLIARIEGLVNVEWVKEKLSSAKFLTGRYGQVVAIAERNLMDLIAERMAAIDWEEKKQQALARFWSHQEFLDLTPAEEDKKRLIDMRIRVPSDVVTEDGKVIARAGEVLNPLERISFRKALIVFDANYQAQIDWAKNTLSKVAKDGLVPVLIATSLPKGKEWETLVAIEQDTGFAVYLLPRQMKERFEIEHTPTLITPHDNVSLELAEFRL